MADISAFFLKLGITFGMQNVPGFKNSGQIFFFFFFSFLKLMLCEIAF